MHGVMTLHQAVHSSKCNEEKMPNGDSSIRSVAAISQKHFASTQSFCIYFAAAELTTLLVRQATAPLQGVSGSLA